MRIRKKPWAEPELAKCDFFVKNPKEYFGKWNLFFKNENPVYLEVGCGKGGFVGQTALNNPNINFLAVDIKSDMLGVARRNIVRLFEENNKLIDNIALVAFNVEQISDLISPYDNIRRIYINFCNPWPKAKHKKRRLTHPTKLNQYRQILPENGEIRFKTDDDILFKESLEYFKECNFEITYITYDLHNSDVIDNVMTEHEKMFSDEGIKIKYLIARKN